MCNIIMTSEPIYTTSKERMALEIMFSSECMPQLSITDSKVKWLLHFTFNHYTVLYKRRTVGEVPLPVTMKNTDDFHL